jgi:hypothetical protein
VRNPGISITGSERGADGGPRNTSLRSNALSSTPRRPSRQIGVRDIEPTLTAPTSSLVPRTDLSRPGDPTANRPSIAPLRAMFITYLVVIVSGIVFFSVIGITHH